MKKQLFLALLLMCNVATAFAQTENVTIKGRIEGIKKGCLYLLSRSSEEKTDTFGFCEF